MKVSELIATLNTVNPEAQVYMSRDEEGNGYYRLDEVESDAESVVLWPGGMEIDDCPIKSEEDEE